jgi:tetratricopeptide (TPR) repeat protein
MHPNVTVSLNNLAYIYCNQGRYGEAEPLYQQALKLNQLLVGDEHPEVATCLNNLAYLYQSQGRYAEAESLYQKTLQLRRSLLGEQHLDVAISCNNLAKLYESQYRYNEAEALYLRSLKILLDQYSTYAQTVTAWHNFRDFLETVIYEGQTFTLSNHPMTQLWLQKLEAGE